MSSRYNTCTPPFPPASSLPKVTNAWPLFKIKTCKHILFSGSLWSFRRLWRRCWWVWEVNVISISESVFPVFYNFSADMRKFLLLNFATFPECLFLSKSLSPSPHFVSARCRAPRPPPPLLSGCYYCSMPWATKYLPPPRRVDNANRRVCFHWMLLHWNRDNVCNLPLTLSSPHPPLLFTLTVSPDGESCVGKSPNTIPQI